MKPLGNGLSEAHCASANTASEIDDHLNQVELAAKKRRADRAQSPPDAGAEGEDEHERSLQQFVDNVEINQEV